MINNNFSLYFVSLVIFPIFHSYEINYKRNNEIPPVVAYADSSSIRSKFYYSEYFDESLINQYARNLTENDESTIYEMDENNQQISKNVKIDLTIDKFGKASCKKYNRDKNIDNLKTYKIACDYLSKMKFEIKYDKNENPIQYKDTILFKQLIRFDDKNFVKIRPLKISGEIQQDDYPPSAVRLGEGGVSRAIFTVDTDGSVNICASYGAGEILDRETCRLIKLRFRYAPAKDGDGKAVAIYQTQTVRWLPPD